MRGFVLKRMREQGLISKPDYNEQVGLPLYVMKRTNPFKVSYAIDYIRQQADRGLGISLGDEWRLSHLHHA